MKRKKWEGEVFLLFLTATIAKIETLEEIETDYKFGKKLGEGATAIVRKAEFKGREVAVKVVDKESGDWDEDSIASFRTEIKVLGMLAECANLVSSLDVRESLNHIYITMDLIEGGELFDAIMDSPEGYFEDRIAARCVFDILNGIEYLHSNNIIHRDIKPENVLLSSKDISQASFKLSDYGAAVFVTPKKPNTVGFTGTVMYMAPEIISGKKYSKAVDIWSLGILTYITCCGFPPFDGEDDGDIMGAIMCNELEFPSPDCDMITPIAMSFIIACLNSEPKERLSAKQALGHFWLKDFA